MIPLYNKYDKLIVEIPDNAGVRVWTDSDPQVALLIEIACWDESCSMICADNDVCQNREERRRRRLLFYQTTSDGSLDGLMPDGYFVLHNKRFYIRMICKPDLDCTSTIAPSLESVLLSLLV